MKITEIGKDLIVIKEEDLEGKFEAQHKIHLIKFNFSEPTKEKVDFVIENFPTTNRFIIGDNIKFYNDILKRTNKKYYVQNRVNSGLISFFRKNNKVLLSVPSLSEEERVFVLDHALKDVLRNLEIIMMEKEDYVKRISKFKNWKGNMIFFDKEVHGFML